MKRLTALALLALALVPRISGAQLSDRKVLTLAAAKTMLAAAQAEATKNGWLLSIAVVDSHGELLAFERMDGAFLATIGIAQGKALTAARYRRESRVVDSAVTAGRVQMMAFPGIIPVEGGVPIFVNNVLIGAIGASGAASPHDAQAAKAGIAALKP